MMGLPISMSRRIWVIVHRWAGLTMALFLIVAGLTGILLPWEEELTLASRPGYSRAAPPHPGARPLDGVSLAERVAAQTGGQVGFVPLDIPADHAARLSVEAGSGQPALGYDTVWADPYTGQVRLKFRYGVLADGTQNIMPFLYRAHYSLALGAWGIWAFGVAALIWTLDCFLGFYLTLPIRAPRTGMPKGKAGKSWWARWRPAWMLRKGARGHKLNFDLHRASGLWLWPLLLVFAWSSVGFCLPSVHRPVMAMLGASEDFTPPTLARPLDAPPIDLRAAHSIGRNLVAREGQRRGFTVEREGYLFYRPAWGLYGYSVRTSADPADDDPQTRIWFDARKGRLFYFQGALGENTTDVVMRCFYMLHMAQVLGLPYRIFVSVLGLAVVALSVTGIAIWIKKRSARHMGKQREGRRPKSRTPLRGDQTSV